MAAPAADEVDVTVCTFDQPEAILPADHTWVEDRLPWIHMADGLPAYERDRSGDTADRSAQVASEPTASADEEAIRTALATYVETWNAHDIEAWGKLFTDDVDYVNRGGGWWESNEENLEEHKAIHEMLIRLKQPMTYKSAVKKIAFFSPTIAIVHAAWKWPGFCLPSGEEAEDFQGIITMVMVKGVDRWLIRAFAEHRGNARSEMT